MDSTDIMDDKDSGPEVQINIPSSVMSRIEELMGGTEQFDNEESLSGVESAAARCDFRLQGVEQDIQRLVRAQAAQRDAGQRALLKAQSCIAELALQITCEIKQLDCAKSNLTAAITALNHLHMLTGGVEQLHSMTRDRQYKEIALPMQAIMEVRGVDQLHSMTRNRQYKEIALPMQAIMELAEACGVVDILDSTVKDELLKWFIDMQLQECAWLSHVERRYAWLKRHLLTFEQSVANIFPPQWGLSQLIATAFCEMTRAQLSALMSSRRAELDVKLLLFAIQKTYNFELLLHKSEPALYPPGSPWAGLVGACFEPHLSLYIHSLDSNLRQLLDTFIQDAKNPAPPAPAAQVGEGAVISSCADLFLLYKKCLVQCSRLTRGEPMLELAGVFQKYLREYASAVLQAALPRAAPSGGLSLSGLGGGNMPSLVSNLQTLLNEGAHPADCSVITTAEYCLETAAHLQLKLREKVLPELAHRVDLSAEQDLFHALIADCIQLLVRDLELGCAPALAAMARVAWLALTAVGDQSPYVTQIALHLRSAIPPLRDSLASSRKYFTQVCIRFASSFIPKFIQNVYKCKPVSTAGAEQLLLDAHMLKTALLELPSLGSAVRRPAPPTYTKVVVRLMTRAEMILKLVMAPLDEGFAAQFARLLPDATLAELHRVLDMKGAKLSKAQLAALDASFKDNTKHAN
ncbi:putative late golgi protein sorting complex subunit vps53 [Operophtera brumata]|uniref:Vacuolar protein sorting-associated protein 53 homolog n=1 Tax=Operophtera brumata TaxID=104452 RepID=A0A0L7LMH4_OPEBR|nr:putative late golgi protein sorting complex subunit vps53 [Operophtera brumata]